MSFPYKLGKLAAVRPEGLGLLNDYVVDHLPPPPASVAVPNFPNWGMLGNDTYGDCGVAGLCHGFEADATVTQEIETWPTDQQVVDYYLTYTNGQDSGVVLSDFLNFVHTNRFYDHSVAAYAPVNVSDVKTIQSVIDLYDFAYSGIQVPDSAMTQFQNGEPWTVVNGAQIEGGHCIPLCGYDNQYLYCVTWGQVQPLSYSFWHTYGDESWAVITGELLARHGDGRGVNITALQSDLSKLNK